MSLLFTSFFLEFKLSLAVNSNLTGLDRNSGIIRIQDPIFPSPFSSGPYSQSEVLCSPVFSSRLPILHSSVTTAHCWYHHCPCLQDLLKTGTSGVLCLPWVQASLPKFSRLTCSRPRPRVCCLQGCCERTGYRLNYSVHFSDCPPLQSWGIFLCVPY